MRGQLLIFCFLPSLVSGQQAEPDQAVTRVPPVRAFVIPPRIGISVDKQLTLDDAQASLHAKQASYDSALQNAKNLRADIDASEAAAKLAERQLRDTAIRAPFDGYVQKRLVNLGEYVKLADAQKPLTIQLRNDSTDPHSAEYLRYVHSALATHPNVARVMLTASGFAVVFKGFRREAVVAFMTDGEYLLPGRSERTITVRPMGGPKVRVYAFDLARVLGATGESEAQSEGARAAEEAFGVAEEVA